MQYEVTVDFGDNAVQAPHICKNLSDLGLYLERVPSMIGFELNGSATVRIAIKEPLARPPRRRFETA